MKRLSLIFLLVFCCGEMCAQDFRPDAYNDPDTMARLNRATGLIELADSESKLNSDLELTEAQILEIKEIALTHSDWMDIGDSIPPEKRADKDFVNELVNDYLVMVKSLESRLSEKVLLPHQVALLANKQFSKALKSCDGDITKAISNFYCDKIKLDDKRKDKLAKISKATKKEIAQARKEFETKLKRILKNSEKATREVFTGSENKLLGIAQD